MAECRIKNTGDIPLTITNPDTGEVYCVLPGYDCRVKPEWEDVRAALQNRRANYVPEKKK